jgi:adenine-specific DNA glycosylase
LELDLDNEEDEDDEDNVDKLRKDVLKYLQSLSIISSISAGKSLKNEGSFTHIFSHIKRTAFVESLSIPFIPADRLKCQAQWCSKSDLDKVGLNTFVKKSFQATLKNQSRITQFFK